MSLQGFTGFEAGVLATPLVSQIDGSAFSVSTTQKKSGNYALRCQPNGSAARVHQSRVASAVASMHVALYFATVPTTTITFYMGFRPTTNSGNIYMIGFNEVPFIYGQSAGDPSYFIMVNPYTTGVWYVFDLLVDCTTTTHTVKAWLNGSLQSTSSMTGQTAGLTLADCVLGYDTASTTGDFYFDDWIWGNASADTPWGGSGIGIRGTEGLIPIGVGTHNLDASPSSFFFKHNGTTQDALTQPETAGAAFSYTDIDELPIASDSARLGVKTNFGGLTPSFRSAGSVTFSSNNVANGSLTPGAPAGKAVGDFLLLLAGSSSNSMTVTTPTGWNLVSGFPKASGTASGGKIYAFTRIADGTATDTPAVTFASLTTGTTGTPGFVVILAVQNVTETLDGTVASSDLSAQTSTSVIPAFTTATDKSYVVGVALKMLESSGQTSTVATFTERVDAQTTSGTGFVVEVSDLVKTPAGSSGTATVTWSATGSARAFTVSMGFKSLAQPAATQYAEHTFTDLTSPKYAPMAYQVITALRNDAGTLVNSIGAKIHDGAPTEPGTNLQTLYSALSIGSATTAYRRDGPYVSKPSGGALDVASVAAFNHRWGYSNNASSTPRLEGVVIEVLLQDQLAGANIQKSISDTAMAAAAPRTATVDDFQRANGNP